MKDVGLLLLRLTVGGLLAGHGAQKLFGAFGGQGIGGMAGWLESTGLKPGHLWAASAGLSEFGGGILLALGLLNPLGSIAVLGAMGMAIVKAHPLAKGIWATNGGGELPLTNMAAAATVAVAGPGLFSFDRLLGLKVPAWFSTLTLLGMLATIAYGANASPEPKAAEPATTQAATPRTTETTTPPPAPGRPEPAPSTLATRTVGQATVA